jgi:hypothetical protein
MFATERNNLFKKLLFVEPDLPGDDDPNAVSRIGLSLEWKRWRRAFSAHAV